MFVTVSSEGQREESGFRPANGLPPGNPSYLYSMSDWTMGTQREGKTGGGFSREACSHCEIHFFDDPNVKLIGYPVCICRQFDTFRF